NQGKDPAEARREISSGAKGDGVGRAEIFKVFGQDGWPAGNRERDHHSHGQPQTPLTSHGQTLTEAKSLTSATSEGEKSRAAPFRMPLQDQFRRSFYGSETVLSGMTFPLRSISTVRD